MKRRGKRVRKASDVEKQNSLQVYKTIKGDPETIVFLFDEGRTGDFMTGRFASGDNHEKFKNTLIARHKLKLNSTQRESYADECLKGYFSPKVDTLFLYKRWRTNRFVAPTEHDFTTITTKLKVEPFHEVVISEHITKSELDSEDLL